MSGKKIDRLRPTFIEHFPDQLEPGVLYVSMKYAMCAHSCACGCGQKVITPLSPRKWKILYDGESVTLSPSIGNYGFPCQSHYFLTKGRIDWINTRERADESQKKGNGKKRRGRFGWFRRKKYVNFRLEYPHPVAEVRLTWDISHTSSTTQEGDGYGGFVVTNMVELKDINDIDYILRKLYGRTNQ